MRHLVSDNRGDTIFVEVEELDERSMHKYRSIRQCHRVRFVVPQHDEPPVHVAKVIQSISVEHRNRGVHRIVDGADETATYAVHQAARAPEQEDRVMRVSPLGEQEVGFGTALPQVLPLGAI